MRIAYVYDAVHPWETGGVQKRVWELARRLAPDHDVHWYGLHYWDGPATVEREGVTLHGVMEPTDLYVDGRRSIPEALRFSARLAAPLARESFDVIDCQEFPYFPAFPAKVGSLLRDATLVFTWHEVWGDYWYDYLGWKGAVGDLVERLVARMPDVHVAVSERTRRDAASIGVADAALVPNGVSRREIEAVRPAGDPVDVLFAGRFIPEKHPELVVRAVDRLREDDPDVRCVLLGDGPEHAAVAELVSELGLGPNVSMPGVLENYEDVLGLMRAADVFVLPSEREGFGISVLEALACGTPVVTTDHPRNAASELVTTGETGVVCEPTGESLADGVRLARADVDPADCTAAARRYEWDRIAEDVESLYRAATGERPTARPVAVDTV